MIGYVCGCAHAFEGREKKSIELSILQNKIIKKYLKTDLSSDDFKKLINDTKNDFGEGFKSGLDLIFYNDVQNITHQTKLEGHILGYNRDSYGRKG